jgi:hypothetical protein
MCVVAPCNTLRTPFIAEPPNHYRDVGGYDRRQLTTGSLTNGRVLPRAIQKSIRENCSKCQYGGLGAAYLKIRPVHIGTLPPWPDALEFDLTRVIRMINTGAR